MVEISEPNRIIINHMIQTLKGFIAYAEVAQEVFTDEAIGDLKSSVASLESLLPLHMTDEQVRRLGGTIPEGDE